MNQNKMVEIIGWASMAWFVPSRRARHIHLSLLCLFLVHRIDLVVSFQSVIDDVPWPPVKTPVIFDAAKLLAALFIPKLPPIR
jgi:hypothetical protein